MNDILSAGQLAQARDVVRKAGRKIMSMRSAMHAAQVKRHKPDGSPFCDADIESHNILVEGLHAIDPKIKILSEENQPGDNAVIFAAKTPYWAIDPIDLTNRYLQGGENAANNYFSINAALMANGQPGEGIQYFPALGVMYYTEEGKAFRQENGHDPQEIIVTLPHSAREGRFTFASHPDLKHDRAFDLHKQIISIGRHRACLVAEGSVTFCSEKAGFCLWDITAIHAVVNAAGGCFRRLDGSDFTYDSIENLPAFFAGHPLIIEQIAQGCENAQLHTGRGI
jgi:3'(2'), 5'-bisphosphate nucleotidase